MTVTVINPDPTHRSVLDEALRSALRDALEAGNVSDLEAASLLVRILPELVAQDELLGLVIASYENARERGDERYPVAPDTLAGIQMLESVMRGMRKNEGSS